MKTTGLLPTFITILLLFVVGSLIIQGCGKMPTPVPPPVQPKVELSVVPSGILPYGAWCTATWNSTDAERVSLNNKTVGATGSVTERLFKDTIYEVVAYNAHLSAKADKEIKVGDWTTSKFGLVSFYPWTFKEFRIILAKDGSIVYREEPTAEEKAQIFYYHKNGNLTSNYLTTTGNWSISEDGNYLIRGGVSKKFSVSVDELSTYQETTWDGELAYFLNVFKHASDTPTDK